MLNEYDLDRQLQKRIGGGDRRVPVSFPIGFCSNWEMTITPLDGWLLPKPTGQPGCARRSPLGGMRYQ